MSNEPKNSCSCLILLELALCVDEIHCSVYAGHSPGPDACNGLFRQSGNLGRLFRREAAKHEIHLATLHEFMTDSAAQSGVVSCSDELLYVLETVMPSVAPVFPEPECAERKVDVIAYNHYVLNRNFELVHPVSYCIPAQIHIGGWLQKMEVPPFLPDGDNVAIAFGVKNDIGRLGPDIQYHESYVVSCRGVFGPNVAESDDQK